MFFRRYPNIGLMLALLAILLTLATSPAVSREMYFFLGFLTFIAGDIIKQSVWFKRIDAEKFKWREKSYS